MKNLHYPLAWLLFCACGEGATIRVDQIQPTGGSGGSNLGGGGQGGSDSGGSGGNGGSGGASCRRGEVVFTDNEQCLEDCPKSLLRPVGDVDSVYLFGVCQTEYTDPGMAWAKCGAGCDSSRCCMLTPSGLFGSCQAIEVCEEGLARGAKWVTFSDFSPFSLDPIPAPESCADEITTWPTCAPGCSACPGGEVCSGRSPLHPVGLCFPDAKDKAPTNCGKNQQCSKGDFCFVWATSKPFYGEKAELEGVCLAEQSCLQVAKYLPGGGACLDKNFKVLEGSLSSPP